MASLEEQVREYKELARQIDELEQKKKEISQSIFQLMTEKTMSVAGYTVRRYERFFYKTSLEDARILGATKMEEVLDKDVLKELHQRGHTVPGITSTHGIMVCKGKEATVSGDDAAAITVL